MGACHKWGGVAEIVGFYDTRALRDGYATCANGRHSPNPETHRGNSIKGSRIMTIGQLREETTKKGTHVSCEKGE